MAVSSWLGNAPAIAGVYNWKFTTAGTIGDVITVTIGSKSVTYTTTSATITVFLPLLQAFLAGLSATTYPEFAELTWTQDSVSVLTAACVTPGKPSIVSVTTNSSGTTINKGTITAATNATPIVVTSTAHGLSNGSVVTVASVGGNTNANGTWIIGSVTANTFTLVGSVGNSAYTSGGTWTAPTGNTTTVSSGPNSIRTAANYSGGVVPATGDTLYVDLEGAQLLYDLEFMSTAYGNAIVLAVRRITSQTVIIGLPATNQDSTNYTEYLQQFWQVTATSDYVNTQSGRIKLDALAGATTYQQDNSGSGVDSGVPAVLLKGSNTSNVWNIFGGNGAGAWFTADTFKAATLNIASGVSFTVGVGGTLVTVNNYGGTVLLYCAVSTALNHPSAGGGTTTIEGTGAVAQITMQSGTCNFNTAGTLGGNTVLANNAKLTVDGDQRAKTITNPISLEGPSAVFSDKNGVVSGGYTIKEVNFTSNQSRKPNSQYVVSTL